MGKLIVLALMSWVAVMVWIGPPHHLRPYVRVMAPVYAAWESVSTNSEVVYANQ